MKTLYNTDSSIPGGSTLCIGVRPRLGVGVGGPLNIEGSETSRLLAGRAWDLAARVAPWGSTGLMGGSAAALELPGVEGANPMLCCALTGLLHTNAADTISATARLTNTTYQHRNWCAAALLRVSTRQLLVLSCLFE